MQTNVRVLCVRAGFEKRICQFNTEFYMENETKLNHSTPPDAKHLLGEVAHFGWENHYTVIIKYNGKDYKWWATRCKNAAFHYTKEVFSNDTFGLKKSVKKKMKQMVEDAVSNLA